MAIVTETWLAQDSRLERDTESLLMGHGLAIRYLNRPLSSNGVAHGGVALVFRDSSASSSSYPFPNPENFEVLPLQLTIVGVKRRLFAISAYIPPNYPVARGRACIQHINNLVLDIKRNSNSCPPYILIAGDFNQWPVGESLEDFPELQEVQTPPTRENRHIDKMFMNFPDDINDSGTVPPLETEGTAAAKSYSDHSIQYLCARLPLKTPVCWEKYSYRPFKETAATAFVQELSEVSWDTLYELQGSNAMAMRLQTILDDLMDRHFPMKTVKRKGSDLPWFNCTAKKMVKKKNAIYKSEGKSERWHAQTAKIDGYLAKGRECFLKNQREKLLGPTASANFFKNVKAFSTVEKPKDFNIRDLRPDSSEGEIAEEAAAYFNRISSEFRPLSPDEIPATYHRDLPLLSPAQVQKMLQDARKTNSMVKGDIFPKLINRCSAYLAWPLSAIFNQITRTTVWPIHWKREYVTVIPKKSSPSDFSDLRNISCTLFFSKVFEGHLLKCMQEEISLKPNQYGGVKGCSTTHMLVDIIQEICENGEDYRCATVLCAIDFAKAFNRMSFQHCLESLRKMNASTPILRLIASFLTNRTMTLRVGQTWSDPLPVSGGCPQGSLLGVILFNATTESLEDDFVLFERRRMGLPTPPDLDIGVEDPADAAPTPNPVCSSPSSLNIPELQPPSSPIPKLPDTEDTFMPRVKLKHLPQPVLEVPPVEQKIGTQVLTIKAVKIFKYVDDNISVDKVNFGRVPITVENGENVKVKQALNLQNAFRSITRKAEEMGMVVNVAKTNLLTVSDSLNFRPKAFIIDSDGNRISSGTKMNILGFHLSDRPNINAHVEYTIKKMRMRYWTLYHLRKVGFTEPELVRVYQSMILPLADYCCPAYHSLMTDLQDQEMERVQIGALRSIFGYGPSANQLRSQANITTLRERRIKLTDKFAFKCLQSERFKKWFPLNETARGRQAEKYKEFFAKCDRLKNSPLYYMRRRLNGKEGKKYGERNRQYRENLNVADS